MFASPDAGGVRLAGASTAVVNAGERKRRSRFWSGKKKKIAVCAMESAGKFPKQASSQERMRRIQRYWQENK